MESVSNSINDNFTSYEKYQQMPDLFVQVVFRLDCSDLDVLVNLIY